MIRRQFMQRITMASAAAASKSNGAEKASATYHIQGFTCITCAAGLETLLRRQKGVLRVEASYPKATARVEYEPSVIGEKEIKQCIADMGFSVRNA